MKIINIEYLVNLDTIIENRPAHVEYLNKYYDKGIFMCSGRKDDSTGGIIIVNTKQDINIEDIAKEDPFFINGLSKYSILEFSPTMMCEQFKSINK
ncbi:MAG: YciI family protein [Mycoplasmatales bacterium]